MSEQYGVEGYGNVQPGYDQPYLTGAGFNPEVVYAFAGDPELQDELQKKLAEAGPSDDFHVTPRAHSVDPTYPMAVPSDLLPVSAILVNKGDTVVVIEKDATEGDSVTRDESEFISEDEHKENSEKSTEDIKTPLEQAYLTRTEDQFVTDDNGSVVTSDDTQHGEDNLSGDEAHELVRDVKGHKTTDVDAPENRVDRSEGNTGTAKAGPVASAPDTDFTTDSSKTNPETGISPDQNIDVDVAKEGKPLGANTKQSVEEASPKATKDVTGPADS